MTAVKTIDAARGQWAMILPALGVPTKLLNHHNQPCPSCGGKDRFRYTNYGGNGSFFCGQCGPGNGIRLLCLVHRWDYKQAFQEVDRVLGTMPRQNAEDPEFYYTKAASPGACRRLFEDSVPIESDSAVGLYLHNRGLLTCDHDFLLMRQLRRTLRYVPMMRYYPHQQDHRGMIAVFSDHTGKAATIHRTYLSTTGRKADFEPNRMFLAGHVPAGGAIRLSAPGEDLTCMGIAEGIETALSVRALRSGLPVWAATGDQLLKQWMPPPEAKEITIFADNDHNYAGQAAAYELAKRLSLEAQRDCIERRILVEIPSKAGTDWNDVLQQGGGELCER